MEERSLFKSKALLLFQQFAQELSLHRDIVDQLKPFPETRKPLLHLLIFYYSVSFAMTGSAWHLLRAESVSVRVFSCSWLLAAYLLNGQLHLETDLLYRLGISEAPGAAIVRNVYLSRGGKRWPGWDFERYEGEISTRMAKFLPRSDPLERFRGLQEYQALLARPAK